MKIKVDYQGLKLMVQALEAFPDYSMHFEGRSHRIVCHSLLPGLKQKLYRRSIKLEQKETGGQAGSLTIQDHEAQVLLIALYERVGSETVSDFGSYRRIIQQIEPQCLHLPPNRGGDWVLETGYVEGDVAEDV